MNNDISIRTYIYIYIAIQPDKISKMLHAYYSKTQFDTVNRSRDVEFPYIYYKMDKGGFVQVTAIYRGDNKPSFPDTFYVGVVKEGTCKVYKEYMDPSTIVE